MSGQSLAVRCRVQRPEFNFEVALELPLHGMTGVFGPSGAGKTTLLRCIAGLERPENGLIRAGDETWQDDNAGVWREVEDRQIGYVFQEPRLFSNLDVRGNLEYGRRRSQARAAAVDFDGVVELLGIRALMKRSTSELSGGEAQRVAIARALLRSPALVLMDEPMASLDTARKDEILPFLERLHAELSTPVVYVSHNIEEIGRLCDHLVVLDGGSAVASGDLPSVLVRMDIDALRGEEAGAVIVGKVADYDASYDLTEIEFPGGTLRVGGKHGDPGTALRLRVRANDVSLCRKRPAQTTILNLVEARIEEIGTGKAASILLRLDAGGTRLLARVTRRSCDELGLRAGDNICAQIKAVAIRG